uniref:Dipeptidyl peptidase 1 n=1 Tax=Ciona savignyi TaxID=51511 RepID=H2ZLT0_CIOSA
MGTIVCFVIVLICCVASSVGDTVANCTHEDLLGSWIFHMSEGGHDKTIDCSKPGPVHKVITISLSSYNTAIVESDHEIGTYNLIYNQGFEVEVGFHTLFAFFAWETLNDTHTKYWCNKTMYGWAHDNLGNNWACFIAMKQPDKAVLQSELPENTNGIVKGTPSKLLRNKLALQAPYMNDMQFIMELNKQQRSWVADSYPELESMTYEQVLSRSGHGNGPIVRSKLPRKLKFSSVVKTFPESFDWRNVNGQNFVSPVRNQGSCGSCYAFASMAMLEARIRIATNNTQTPVFSPQEVVSCSQYAQGCAGGFPFLIAGKYAHDFGVVEEQCYPYLGKDTDKCEPAMVDCKRHYVAKYEYVGGYYGACSEEKMIEDLVAFGPIAVAIEVYPDFQQYKSGIYHHVTSVERNSPPFNPFELTNHAVLVVGYGADPSSGEKYWIVKNSWGESWGEKGFVRIRRGVDEIAISSLAQQSFPIPELE